jgi:hypothetical protein
MDDGSPFSTRYVIWSSLNWVLFIAAVAFLTWGGDGGDLSVGLVWAIILFVAGTVAAQFYAAYRLVTVQDEFIRGLTAKRGIAATGVTITAAVLWGLVQQFLPAPSVPMWVVYPLFWGAFGMVTPLIRSSLP